MRSSKQKTAATGEESTLSPLSTGASAGGGHFNTTHWSVVLAATEDASDVALEALEKLCRAYWYPLYVFVRRRGYDVHEAQDLTQSFFARLLDKNYLRAVDRSKGKFRSFLLAALEHFLANEWRRAQAQKRGGKAAFISLDDPAAEQQYLQAAVASLEPEKLFERQWATTLLEQVLARLRQEFAAAGKEASFDRLKVFLVGEKTAARYSELAAKLGTTEAALKMAVSRLKQRYRQLLRSEILLTVSGPGEVDEELRALFAALSG